MTEDVRALIESLRRGRFEDPTEPINLLAAALKEDPATDAAALLTLLRAPQASLRLAALQLCVEHPPPQLLEQLTRLAKDPDTRVRVQLAEVAPSLPRPTSHPLLVQLLADTQPDVRVAALKASAGQNHFLDRQTELLRNDDDWNVRLAAASALGQQSGHPQVTIPLFHALVEDDDDDVQRRCAELLENRLNAERTAVERHLNAEPDLLARAEHLVRHLGPKRFPVFHAWLSARAVASPNLKELAQFGTDLTAQAERHELTRACGLQTAVLELLQLLQQEKPRPVALLGESGTGKTALVHELVHELALPQNGSWRVLRLSPADFMANTRYLGDWETRVKNLIRAVRKPRRVLLYVPNLGDLISMGQWDKSDYNVALALAPALEEGSLVLLGESTPAEFERGLGTAPTLRRLFQSVLIPESTEASTRVILEHIAAQSQSAVPESVLDLILDLSNFFLSHQARPGNAAGLLRSILDDHAPHGPPLCERDALQTLARSTGIPVDLLDDANPLSAETVREFFHQRILGQPEAVQSVVDLIQLIKAGLTDPRKPFGVFLFVGPTGVGKTELARALAEYIFGDTARLLRFDMSEYASYEAFERLLGTDKSPGRLTDAVRRQPFSVVLLDEIEKSHLNVFDLCLQLFDAGRLTDGRGRTVDFRRTIIILTSNIGATAPSPVLGFRETPPAAPDAERDRVEREVSRFFRPEFLNRLDRIVHFRPLALEVAEQIARREIESVLERRGVARRQVRVDVDPAVLSLLVRQGYSAHFGARPLKRTVERLLLLPLARLISEGRLGPGALVRLELDGSSVLPRRVDTGLVPATVQTREITATESKAPSPETLAHRCAAMQPALASLQQRKEDLLARTRDPDFQRKASDRALVLGDIHRLDQFITHYERVGSALARLQERLQSPRPPTDAQVAERLRELDEEIDRLEFVARCPSPETMGDTLIILRLVDRRGHPRDSLRRLTEIYLSASRRRDLETEILGEWFNEREDSVWLQVEGLGAYALFARESGLHQFEHRYLTRTARGGRERQKLDRELVRVEVLPIPGDPPRTFITHLKTTVRPLKPAQQRLLPRLNLHLTTFDTVSLRSLDFWTTGPRTDAIPRAQRTLYTLVRTSAPSSADNAATAVVRCYQTGTAPRVKDLRSGRSTTRTDLVFKGRLDLVWDRDWTKHPTTP